MTQMMGSIPEAVANHVTIGADGIPRIDGSRFKVIHVAAAVRSGLDTPRALHDSYPQLTLAQICSALAYYYDHQVAMDKQIDEELAEAEAMRAAAPETPGRAKLRQMGLRP